MSGIGGILFDMDGVLCDSEPFIREAACAMFAHCHKITVQPDDFRPFSGTGEDRFLGGVAEQYGVHLNMPADKDWTYHRYLRTIDQRLEPLAGAGTFIARARAAGLRLAVASSADWIKVEGNLRQIELPPERFDAVVCASDVRRKKPDPEIFLLAAERLGLPPEQCLVIEDAPSGLEAARRARCPALGITSSFSDEQLTSHGASWTCPSLAAPPEAIDLWLSAGAANVARRSSA
ncbi:MAG: HAD-IA family hydrolase [Phycisphaeraceae bacterium]|nr:HAD-IA family hydrolase [Phycisphaeraceae bacterium]